MSEPASERGLPVTAMLWPCVTVFILGSLCFDPEPGNNTSFSMNIYIWILAHHHNRILYEFKFYVPHSTSDAVSSMFLVFLA